MEWIGEFRNISQDFESGKFKAEITIDNTVVNELHEHLGEQLKIKVSKNRKKRSLDSNAYAWVLMQKLAEKTHTDKWSVYLTCLQRYSRAFTHVVVKPEAVERMKELYRTCIDLGEITINGQDGHQLQVYYGSSTFDTKEMSIFIEGIVSECKDLGIETLTPKELRIMNERWNNEKCTTN